MGLPFLSKGDVMCLSKVLRLNVAFDHAAVKDVLESVC